MTAVIFNWANVSICLWKLNSASQPNVNFFLLTAATSTTSYITLFLLLFNSNCTARIKTEAAKHNQQISHNLTLNCSILYWIILVVFVCFSMCFLCLYIAMNFREQKVSFSHTSLEMSKQFSVSSALPTCQSCFVLNISCLLLLRSFVLEIR